MTLIVDPDSLNQGTEVTITPGTKKIALNIAGNLSTDGVTLKCLYSFLKEEWLLDANLVKYPFPMGPITDEQFEFINGWDLLNDASKYLIRTGGWALKDPATGLSQEEWAGVVTLGSLGGSDQVYFQQSAGGAAADFQLTGAVNQAIKVYGDVTHGSIDYRNYLKLFVRVYQKTYASSQLTDIGVSALTYQVYRFPLANGSDLKVTHPDGDMTAGVYANIDITWSVAPVSRTIGGVPYNFHVIIEGNNATAEQIYEKVQYLLRQSTDIDKGSGSVIGETNPDILRFVGDTLYTLVQPGGKGVYIDNFQAADTNRIYFADDNGDNQKFPYVAAIAFNFGENLVNDPDAYFWAFFTNDDAGDNSGRDYGTSTAIIVKDNDGNDMKGSVTGHRFRNPITMMATFSVVQHRLDCQHLSRW